MKAAKGVEQLLDDGLSHFGVGEVDRAVECWEEVLRLDPENAVARDYLDNARTEVSRPEVASLLGDARDLLARDQLEEALDHFQISARLEPERLELELYVDLLRAALVERYRHRLGDLSARPQVQLDAAAIARCNLSADAGFLLSRLDGATSLDEVISLSGMDAFGALRILNRLFDAGIVGASA